MKIKVQFNRGFTGRFYIKEVDADLVGGPEGILAVWKEEREDNTPIVHIAAGDDGSWWHVLSYDISWANKIIGVLQKYRPEEY